MKYVNKYPDSVQFDGDTDRLNTLDDTWAAFIEEENKTTIKLRNEVSDVSENTESVSE